MAYVPTGQPRGRPPKPEALRQGHRKGHLTVVQPGQQPRRPAPRPPPSLLPETRALWRNYWRSPVAQAVDRNADAFLLERWIRAVDEYQRVWPVFHQARFFWNDKDQLVLNPLAHYLHQLELTIARAETQLGLTPVARVRLGITIGQERLTAAALNRMLDKAGPQREEEPTADADQWMAGWEPA